jgi:hypothetical protein
MMVIGETIVYFSNIYNHYVEDVKMESIRKQKERLPMRLGDCK